MHAGWYATCTQMVCFKCRGVCHTKLLNNSTSMNMKGSLYFFIIDLHSVEPTRLFLSVAQHDWGESTMDL